MSEETDLKETIEKTAQTAASTSVDGMSVSNRRVEEVIAADKYLSRKKSNKLSFGRSVFRAPEHF